MTPEEAVAELKVLNGDIIEHRHTIKLYIDACVATAKADEARRCAKFVRYKLKGPDSTQTIPHADYVADAILIAGGLEVDG